MGLEERLIDEDHEIWEEKSTALLYGLVLTHHAPSSVEPPLRADPLRASMTRRLTRAIHYDDQHADFGGPGDASGDGSAGLRSFACPPSLP